MKVTAKLGRNGMITHIDGVICFFDDKHPQPKAGESLEVMISHTTRQRDDGAIAGLIVRPVTAEDVLVSHGGFECAGSMCCTSAFLTKQGAGLIEAVAKRRVSYLTPGRTPVVVADNAGFSRNSVPTPGNAYVALADIAVGLRRICGVADLSELDPSILAGLALSRKPRQAIAA